MLIKKYRIFYVNKSKLENIIRKRFKWMGIYFLLGFLVRFNEVNILIVFKVIYTLNIVYIKILEFKSNF